MDDYQFHDILREIGRLLDRDLARAYRGGGSPTLIRFSAQDNMIRDDLELIFTFCCGQIRISVRADRLRPRGRRINGRQLAFGLARVVTDAILRVVPPNRPATEVHDHNLRLIQQALGEPTRYDCRVARVALAANDAWVRNDDWAHPDGHVAIERQQIAPLPEPQRVLLERRYREALNIAEGAWFEASSPISPEAEAKGWALLLEHLTDKQRVEVEKFKHFTVIGSNSKEEYLINTSGGTSFNISNKKRRMAYCFKPNGGLCKGDVYLSQKLALETREPEALRVANQATMPNIGPGAWWMAEP